MFKRDFLFVSCLCFVLLTIPDPGSADSKLSYQQASHTSLAWPLMELHEFSAFCQSIQKPRPTLNRLVASWTLERQRTNRVDLPAVNRAPVLNALSVACLILLFIDARGCIVEHDRGREGIGSKGRLIQTEEDEEGGS